MDDIAKRNIIARVKDFIRAVNSMYWLFDDRAAVAQAANEFLPEDERTPFSWNKTEQLNLWIEAMTPFYEGTAYEHA